MGNEYVLWRHCHPLIDGQRHQPLPATVPECVTYFTTESNR